MSPPPNRRPPRDPRFAREVYGTELRYLLTDLISGPERRVWQVAELVEAMDRAGFVFHDRPTKVISDALRTEVDRGRVIRVGWGRYAAGHMPGSTRRRIRNRARAARVAAERAAFDDAVRSAG